MSRVASLLLSRFDSNAQGSVAYVNRLVESLLHEAGWSTRSLAPPHLPQSQEAILPLALAGAYASEAGCGAADIALYDEAGILMRAPSRRWARRNVVLYHGLAYGTGIWMGNPEIDLHCANSPYLASLLRATLGFPDWRNRRCLDERAFSIVTDVALPLPCLSEVADGNAFTKGADLTPEVRRLLDSGAVVGHSVQPRKQDIMATVSILYWLNVMARENGTPPVKVVLSASSLEPAQRQRIDAMFRPAGFQCTDFFVLVTQLKQAALFQLMCESRFCLAYNRFPEPFGFYALESVFHGCPVYTNGVGNNRHLLPPHHGIVVDEAIEMAGDTVEAGSYRQIAARIYSDFGRKEFVKGQCAEGAQMIRARWSREAFARGLNAALARAEGVDPKPLPFEDLVISLSPTVRRLQPESGLCLNDYCNTALNADEVKAVVRLLGSRCANLDGVKMQELEEEYGLFRRGILALAPSGQAVMLD